MNDKNVVLFFVNYYLAKLFYTRHAVAI